MGRPRNFDEREVLAAASTAFTSRGYEATSIDDLLVATGLHRGSLYQAFASKRGLFLAVLRARSPHAGGSQSTTDGAGLDASTLDLLLVAALELAPRDEEVRAVVSDALQMSGADEDAALMLGHRLLQRARITPAPTRTPLS